MGVTKLLRKARKNKSRAHNRLDKIKDLMRKPEVKNVDVEAIKAEFAAANKQESKGEKAETTPKSEKKEVAPKAKQAEATPEAKAEEAPQPAAEKTEARDDKSRSAE